jgi:hypothetical protein
MYVGTFANDKAVGRGAFLDKNGRIIKAGYANSPDIGHQYFLGLGDSFISENDGYFGYDQVSLYVKSIQERLARYMDASSRNSSISKIKPSDATPAERSSSNAPPSDVNALQQKQKQKCMRLGLTSGTDDFKLCMQQ